MSISVELIVSIGALFIASMTLLLRMRKDRLAVDIKLIELSGKIDANKTAGQLEIKRVEERLVSEESTRLRESKTCQTQQLHNQTLLAEQIKSNALSVSEFLKQNQVQHGRLFDKMDEMKDLIIDTINKK